MEKILKRDGEIVEFNSSKITDAITKASQITNEFDAKTAQKLTRNVLKIVKDFVREKQSNLKAPTVEEIQDIVEKVLLSSNYKATAKAYILYREQHLKMREFAKDATDDMVDEYLKKLDWQVNENSNMGYSIQGLNNYLASNFINSDMSPEDARSMCYRLRIDNRELEYRSGGLFGSNPLTGSVGVVTLDLPKIAYQAMDETEFFALLKERMLLAKNSLEIKRKLLEKLTDANLYPYTKFYLHDIKSRFGVYWKNHFSTIGLIGMNEACLNLFGQDITSGIGYDFALRAMDFMRAEIRQYQIETGNNYNLEATPAEGTSYRLALKDKKNHPSIICANDKDYYEKGTSPFYTNSTQLPVNYTDDLFELLDHKDNLQTKYTGGTVVHIFAGERITDIKTMKNLVKKVCENYHLPYFTFSPTFSTCPKHGYVKGEHEFCPECGEICEVYSRIVGYIRPISQ